MPLLRTDHPEPKTDTIFPMQINTIIVDDEKPAREELAYLLKGFPEINVIGQGKNGVDAFNLIKEHAPDLVFLDVQMPGLDGFGVLKRLVERKVRMPHVVFATAFDHYAVQAFDVNAVDYVLKPFDKSRISKAIHKARREIEAQTSPTERLELVVPRRAEKPVQFLVQGCRAVGAHGHGGAEFVLRVEDVAVGARGGAEQPEVGGVAEAHGVATG